MRWKRTTAASLMLATMATAGCDTFYPPVNFVPVNNRLSDDQPMGVMQSNSNRRFVYVIKRSKDEPGAATKPAVFVYAEPPPDTALQSALRVAATLPSSVSGDVSVAQEIINLTNRTQTIVLLRDSLFRLIEARANGVIGDDQYQTMFTEVFRSVHDLSSGQTEASGGAAKAVRDASAAIAAAASGTPAKAWSTSATRPAIDPRYFESLDRALETLDRINARGGDGTGPR